MVRYSTVNDTGRNATVKGKILDEDKTPLEFANVSLMQKDMLILGTITDKKGEFSLTPVPSGTYDFVVTFVGLKSLKLKELEIKSGTTKIVDDIIMQSYTLEVIAIKEGRG